jgi:hypothetical protein
MRDSPRCPALDAWDPPGELLDALVELVLAGAPERKDDRAEEATLGPAGGSVAGPVNFGE